MPNLDIQTPGGHQTIELDKEAVSVGRQMGNTLMLKDDLVSRFHCVIEQADGQWQLRDLGSRNGVKVNGQPVKSRRLEDGDLIQVGRTQITFDSAVSLAGMEPDPIPEPPTPRAEKIDTSAPPDKSLKQLAESLPEKPFGVLGFDILNARGHIVHAANTTPEGSAEAVMLLRMVLLVCFRTRASDVHVEPKTGGYTIRIRVDGGMVEVAKLKKETGVRLTSLVKILADIDIAQRNIIQEGGFGVRLTDRGVDYRVSFTPSMYGQKLVLRVLDAANSPRYLWDLGLPESYYKPLERAMKRDEGMFLVCGPTGSGKTATLYASIRSIDTAERNVVTIEDPVEIKLPGVTQMPVVADQGNTFANLLRSTLRQDPDVIMVGEIRDDETAKTALQAAMTGHLVFSTVHSKDTLGTIFRLIDLGVEPYAVASGLQIVLGQRLVRRLCDACKRAVAITPDQRQQMGTEAEGLEKICTGVGCGKCLGTGYAGRGAIFELLNMTDEVRYAIQAGQGPMPVVEVLKSQGFRKLAQNGYAMVARGDTSFEEIDRVVGD
ncbi:MAG: ATPase, T2SS/T4P/T4SS family [Phycisphaerae bacterium]